MSFFGLPKAGVRVRILSPGDPSQASSIDLRSRGQTGVVVGYSAGETYCLVRLDQPPAGVDPVVSVAVDSGDMEFL